MRFLWMTVMNKLRNRMLNNMGLTLVEIIMTIAVAGILIVPLMSMFVFSAKINAESSREFKAVQQAQFYMEEIKSMDEFGIDKYAYNSDSGKYERFVDEMGSEFGVEVIISYDGGIIYYISISVIDEGEVISSLEGSVIFY